MGRKIEWQKNLECGLGSAIFLSPNISAYYPFLPRNKGERESLNERNILINRMNLSLKNILEILLSGQETFIHH